MAAALELIVLPAILLTAIALLLLKTSLGTAGVVATAVFLGLLYFVVIKLLRQMRRWDHEQMVSEREAFEQAEHEGEERERAEREPERHEPAEHDAPAAPARHP